MKLFKSINIKLLLILILIVIIVLYFTKNNIKEHIFFLPFIPLIEDTVKGIKWNLPN